MFVCDSRGRYLVALGRSWHPEEFTCSQCKKVLDEGGFFEERGSVYCTKCYDNRYAPNCAKCKKKITGVRAALLHGTKCLKRHETYWMRVRVHVCLHEDSGIIEASSRFVRKSCMPWRWPTMFSASSVQPARPPSGTRPFTWRRESPTVREVREWRYLPFFNVNFYVKYGC